MNWGWTITARQAVLFAAAKPLRGDEEREEVASSNRQRSAGLIYLHGRAACDPHGRAGRALPNPTCHTATVLEVARLGKRFGGKWVFRGIDFRLAKGDRLVVLGRNGAGKSTLLKTICGLLTPTEGRVQLPSGDPRLALGVSTLDGSLYPSLTAYEHLNLTADLRGCRPRADELLEYVGLAYAGNLRTSQMSTGMRARLKLAIAIQAEPPLLLLDEPGAGLDEAGRETLKRVCQEQTERGVLVLATNDPLERRFASLELDLGA